MALQPHNHAGGKEVSTKNAYTLNPKTASSWGLGFSVAVVPVEAESTSHSMEAAGPDYKKCSPDHHTAQCPKLDTLILIFKDDILEWAVVFVRLYDIP